MGFSGAMCFLLSREPLSSIRPQCRAKIAYHRGVTLYTAMRKLTYSRPGLRLGSRLKIA